MRREHRRLATRARRDIQFQSSLASMRREHDYLEAAVFDRTVSILSRLNEARAPTRQGRSGWFWRVSILSRLNEARALGMMVMRRGQLVFQSSLASMRREHVYSLSAGLPNTKFQSSLASMRREHALGPGVTAGYPVSILSRLNEARAPAALAHKRTVSISFNPLSPQ